MQCRNCGQPIYETTVNNSKQLVHTYTGCYYCDNVKCKGEFADPVTEHDAPAYLPFVSSFIEVK